jgi:hypothetical protein
MIILQRVIHRDVQYGIHTGESVNNALSEQQCFGMRIRIGNADPDPGSVNSAN